MAKSGQSNWESAVKSGAVEPNYAEKLDKLSKKSWSSTFAGQMGIALGATAAISIGMQTGGFQNMGQLNSQQLGMDLTAAAVTETAEYVLRQRASGVILSKLQNLTFVKTLQAAYTKAVTSAAIKLSASTTGKIAIQTAHGAAWLAKGLSKLLGGAVGIALLLIQVAFMLIDMYWNPFKTYFNKDLVEFKTQMEKGIREELEQLNMAYPLESKPNIQPQTEEEIKEYKSYYNDYMENRGLVSAEEIKSILDIHRETANLKRQRQFTINKYVNTLALNVFDEQAYWANYIVISMTETDVLSNRTIIMLLTAALYKRGLITRNRRTVFRDIEHYLEVNWLRVVAWSIILFLLALSILFVINKK